MNTANFIQIYEAMRTLDFEGSFGMTKEHHIVRNEKIDSYSRSYNNLMESLESIGVLNDHMIKLILELIKSAQDLESFYSARSFELGREIGLNSTTESINRSSQSNSLEKKAI